MKRINKGDLVKNIILEYYNYGDYGDNYYDNLSDHISSYFQNGKTFEGNLGDCKEFYNGLIGICNEVKQNNIDSTDFLNPNNLGFKNGQLAFFDMGYGQATDVSNFKNDAISIDEESNSLESHKLFQVAQRVFQHLKISQPKVIGAGYFGLAFRDNSIVYKITTDLSEGYNAKLLVGKHNKHLADYYTAKPFKYQDNGYFLIELEYLQTYPTKMKYYLNKLDSILYDANEQNDEN